MNSYLYFAVFISGMTSLAVEMLASRLLGPDFGTSNLVWASIIGLILIYLTLGYFIGGKWADRSPHPRTMYTVLAWAAFTTGLPPLIARPVLWAAAEAFDQLDIGVWAGSFAAVLVLFCIPVTLMGTASPFAIRIAITNPCQSRGDIRAYLCHFHTGFIRRHFPANPGIDPHHRNCPFIPGFRMSAEPGSTCWFMDIFWMAQSPALVVDAGGSGDSGSGMEQPANEKNTRTNI